MGCQATCLKPYRHEVSSSSPALGCGNPLFIVGALDTVPLHPPPPPPKSTVFLRFRFPAPFPGSNSGKRVAIIREIERQASEAWRATPCEVPVDSEAEASAMAVAAYDFLTVQIPVQSADNNENNYRGGGTRSQVASRQTKRRKGPHSGGTR
jgi:hypothetical protein